MIKGLLKKIFGNSDTVKPVLLLNISDKTNEWNKYALERSEQDRLYTILPRVSSEQMRKDQERTYEWNKYALQMSENQRKYLYSASKSS